MLEHPLNLNFDLLRLLLLNFIVVLDCGWKPVFYTNWLNSVQAIQIPKLYSSSLKDDIDLGET